MKRIRVKLKPWQVTAIGALLLGTVCVYEWNCYPLAGFLSATLLMWLAVEDARTQMLDMRVAITLALSLLLWRAEALPVFAFFYLGFKAMLWGMAKFHKPAETEGEEAQKPGGETLDSRCCLGFIPFVVLSLFIGYTIDMLWHPMTHVSELAGTNAFCGWLFEAHLSMLGFGIYLTENPAYLALAIGTAAVLAVGTYLRLRHKKKQGYAVTYAMGDGDPIVLASVAMLTGGEVFFYPVLMGAILLVALYHGFLALRKGRKGEAADAR